MHIAILMSNTDRSAFADRHPKDGEKWPALLSPMRPGWRFTVYNATAGDLPQSLERIDGVLITGSPASVNEKADWVQALLALVRRIVASGVPLFGACFGHQAIALALGGAVGDNPGPFVLGVAESRVVRPLPWMAEAPETLHLAAAHGEQVTRLPEGARIWSTADGCPVAGFALGDRVFTTEYHPEIGPDFLSALVEEVAPKMDPAVIERARASLDTPMDREHIARWIVAFFEYAAGQPGRSAG